MQTQLMRFFCAAFVALAFSAGPASAGQPPATAASIGAPSLSDIGAPGAQPFVMLCMGQSNNKGHDDGGSKIISQAGAGIWVTNDFANPSALVQAAFGTAPLNLTYAGATTTNPALSNNNSCVQTANYLRVTGTVNINTPILVVYNVYDGQSIDDWVDASANIYMWGYLVNTTIPLVTSWMTAHGYPSAWKINLIDWKQGEADNVSAAFSGSLSNGTLTVTVAPTAPAEINTSAPLYGAGITPGSVIITALLSGTANTVGATYSTNSSLTISAEPLVSNSLWASQPLYTSAFGSLTAQIAGLPQFDATNTKMVVGELGQGYGHFQQNRNDFFHTLAHGAYAPWITLVATPTTGATFTGTLTSGTLVASNVLSGSLTIGDALGGANLSSGPTITAEVSGTPGGAGTYSTNGSLSISAETMSAQNLSIGELVVSAENPPHWSGASSVLIGQRVAQAYSEARISGRFNGFQNANGGAKSYTNFLSVGGAGITTYLTADAVQSNASVSSAGGTLYLPDPSVTTGTISLGCTGTTIVNSTGSYQGANIFIPSQTGLTATPTNTFVCNVAHRFRLEPFGGYWNQYPTWPVTGNTRDYTLALTPGATSGTGVGSGNMDGLFEWTSNNTIGVTATAAGARGRFWNYGNAAGVTTLTGTLQVLGATSTVGSYTVQPGAMVEIETAPTGNGGSLASVIVYDSAKSVPLSGTTSSIGGGALTLGACASGTASIPGATTSMAVQATPVTYPGAGFDWGRSYVSSAGTVTVQVCADLAGTPTASAYNVRVMQ